MASLKDLANRVKEYLTPKTGGLATGVRNWASNTYVPTSQPATQSLQNLSQRLGNVLTQVKKSPQELSPFTARQFIGGGQLPEALTQFRGAAMQPLSFGAVKNQEPEPTTKLGNVARLAGTIGGSIPAFMGAQNIVTGGISNFNRLPLVGKVASEAVVGALGVGATTAGNARERLKEATKQFTPTNIAIGGIIPIAGSISQKKMVANVIKDSLPIKRALMDIQNLDILTQKNPTAWMQKVDNIEKLAQKTLPDVVNSRYMKEIKTSKPQEWFNHIGSAWRDRLEIATGQELPIGFQSKPIGGSKAIMEAEKLKGLTPEVTNTPSSQQSTISQLSPSPIVPRQQVSPLNNIIPEKPNVYFAEPKPKSSKLTEAEYRKSVREGLGATLTKEQLLDKQVADIAKMIQESTEKGIQRRISGKGATVFLAEPSTKKKIQDQKAMANDAYKDWQSQLFKQEGTLTKEQLLKKQISSIGDQIKTNTAVGGVPASDIKDISGFKSYTRDVYRNFQEAYGSKFKNIKRTLLDPFDRAKGNLSRSYEKWASRVNKEVEIDLGIKKGSKESAAVQLFGEGKLKPSQLIEQFGRDKAEKIVNADRWFRTEYDKLLDEVNGVMARIYPNNPEKIIPKRSDYYRHFREMGNSVTGLLNIFDSPSNISSSLAGTSEFVKPRSKWLSFAQKRLGDQSDIDAVGGFIDYIKAAEYNKNIDPFTNQFRRLAEDLAIQTEKDPKLNNFIEYLNDFSNDLAGKTNPADRFVQKIIPGGRKTMSVINWLNNRVKANTIVGNLSSTIAQIFNVPQGIADAGVGNSTKGLGLSMANIFGEATPIKKSDFITERYGGGAFDRFDRSMVDNVKKGAVWITGVLDEVGTKYIWNSQYAKALSENIQNPIKFADDRTRALVAGRGIGEVPLIQKSKIFQLVAPFQLEVGNLWHVMGDWVGEKKFGKLATFFIASHLFNKAAEQIRGSDVSIDPIQASIDAYNTYSEEEDKKLGSLKAIGRMGGEVLSNIPGAQSAAAVYPEFGFEAGGVKFPTREEFFGEGDPTRFGSGLLLTKGLQDPLYKIIPPFGGNQLKRTIEGQQATNRGYSESATGRVRFPTEDTPARNLQRAIFGEYSTPAAREYFKNDTSVLGEKQSEIFKSLSPDKAKEYHQNTIQKRGLEKEKDKLKKDLESQGKSSVNQVYAGEEMPLSISKDQLDVEKLKFEMSDEQTRQISDGVFLLRTESGNPSVIDITKEIPEPNYSGNQAMDKKRKTAYKSALSRRGTDIVKLVDSGLLTEEQGQALMDEVEIKYSGTLKAKKPKSIKIKSVKYNTPKLTKTARKSAPKISISTVKLPKSVKRNITISKPKKISVKGFKNTLSSSVKLA